MVMLAEGVSGVFVRSIYLRYSSEVFHLLSFSKLKNAINTEGKS